MQNAGAQFGAHVDNDYAVADTVAANGLTGILIGNIFKAFDSGEDARTAYYGRFYCGNRVLRVTRRGLIQPRRGLFRGQVRRLLAVFEHPVRLTFYISGVSLHAWARVVHCVR